MFQRILVPLDGTALAEEALPVAAHLARATSAELILLRVATRPLEQDMLAVEPEIFLEQSRAAKLAEAKAYLTHVVTYEHLDDIKVRTEALEGLPAQNILHFAQEEQVDLIVIRSHGETGLKRWLLGSMAQQFARHSTIPLLVLHSSKLASGMNLSLLMHTPRVLVALDRSQQAEDALLPAAQLCSALAAPGQGSLHLTCTVKHISMGAGELKAYNDRINQESRAEAEAYLKNVKQRFLTGDLALFHLTVTTSVVSHFDSADIWKRLIEESECIGDGPGYTGCDIIAMATHGRRGLQRLIEGSITEQVMDGSQRPLLIVHTQKAEEKTLEASETKHA